MLQGEHSAILSIFIKLPIVIKICVLSIFEWPLKTGFTVDNCVRVWTLRFSGKSIGLVPEPCGFDSQQGCVNILQLSCHKMDAHPGLDFILQKMAFNHHK